MEKIISKITENWNRNTASDVDNILIAEEVLNVIFPEDYISFLKWSNGGEGYIGKNYISLWKIEDLAILNQEYQIQKYLSKKYMGIGTNGGGMCYGFCLDEQFTIFKCPLGDLDANEISIIANSISDFFEKALKEEL